MALNKRILRDLKDNFFRYFALFLIASVGIMLVISLSAAADTVIKTTKDNAVHNFAEDGQFSVFIPLSDEVVCELDEKGVTIEQNFYLDFFIGEDSTLRVFRSRKNINLPAVDEGRLPETENEIFLEKIYAQKHKLTLGNELTIAGMNFTVSGIGSVPDYECIKKNLSDVGTDAYNFSVALLTDRAYDMLKDTGLSKETELYLYSFLINGSMTADQLKEYLLDIDFDEARITDPYLREMLNEMNEEKNKINDGIAELADGSARFSDGLSVLDGNSAALNEAAGSILDTLLLSASQQLGTDLTDENYTDVLEAAYIKLAEFPEKAASITEIKSKLDSLSAFKNGLSEYTGGVAEAKTESEKLSDGIEKLQEETERMTEEYFSVEIPNLTAFLTAEDNLRIGAAADDITISKISAIFGGVILLMLFSYVISVFVIHNIDRESEVIGALYSLGYLKKELLRHYLILPTVIAFLGGAMGTLLGILTTPLQYNESILYFSYPQPINICPPYLLVYGLLMPPVISVLVNLLVINKKLSQAPLKMLRHEKKSVKISHLTLGKMSFVRRFQIRQMLREIRANLTLCGGMLISLLFIMLSVNCYALVQNMSEQNKTDTKFSFMYTLKYAPDSVPENGEACYAETLKKEIFGYDLDVTLMGIDNDNPYFPFEVSNRKNDIAVSSSMALKYLLQVGDRIVLSDSVNARDYVFTVGEIVPYSVGLNAFINIDAMRELFGQEEDYYNVLLSEQELDIETGRLYSVITYKDITGFAEIMGNMMWGMIVFIGIVSMIIFVVVLYLMLKMMIDRSSFSVSLIKVFGYNDREVQKLYLGGNFWTVLISSLICVPLAKWMMDSMYPLLIANIASGVDYSFSPLMYVFIFGLIFVSYFSIHFILTRRLRKISYSEVLKNRE